MIRINLETIIENKEREQAVPSRIGRSFLFDFKVTWIETSGVVAAEPVAIDVSVKLLLDNEYETADIGASIRAYLQSIAFKQKYVSVGRI